jgi:hypothetical protein
MGRWRRAGNNNRPPHGAVRQLRVMASTRKANVTRMVTRARPARQKQLLAQ